jgi:hypothetical protein
MAIEFVFDDYDNYTDTILLERRVLLSTSTLAKTLERLNTQEEGFSFVIILQAACFV